MALTTTPVFPQSPKCAQQQILNATNLALVSIYTGGANGSKIFSLVAQSTDTVDRNVKLYITTGGTDYPIGTVLVPANSGNTGTIASVNLFNAGLIPGLPVDSDGNPFIFLGSASFILKASVLVQLTSATTITITAMLADF